MVLRVDEWPQRPPVPGSAAPPKPPRLRRRNRLRILLLFAGLGCIVAGGFLLAGPVFNVWQRGQADQSAVNSWQSGGAAALACTPARCPSETPGAVLSCGSASSSDYAFVKFLDPSVYRYVGVAGDGNWDSLQQRSMVHYHGTPDPGQQGNVIIAFHREPGYEHIDQLVKGGTISVEDRACHVWQYRVTSTATVDPNSRVTQLDPTSGHDLTLITCTPWWVDTKRIVWRATLIA